MDLSILNVSFSFNLGETVQYVKQTMGDTYSVRAASGPGDWESDQQLIEATKQQSMQEMV